MTDQQVLDIYQKETGCIERALRRLVGQPVAVIRDEQTFRTHVIDWGWEALPGYIRMKPRQEVRFEEVMLALRKAVYSQSEGKLALRPDVAAQIQATVKQMLAAAEASRQSPVPAASIAASVPAASNPPAQTANRPAISASAPEVLAAFISFVCPSCQKPLKVKGELAGKRGKCPNCQNAVVVPSAAQAVTTPGAVYSPVTGQASVASIPAHMATMAPNDTASGEDEGSPNLDFLAPPQNPGELGTLGSYRVLKVLGAGGMGMVLQAEEPALKRMVALKVMLPELAAKEVNRQRFLREAQATAAIEHPNIVAIHQVGQDRGVPFIAMPFLKGESLDQRLKREKKLSPAECVRIGRQVAGGLAAAHEHGLIHRDIKPGNIWLEAKTNLVKIVDFGLARGLAGDDVALTKSGAILGTPAYMSPEQASGQKVDHRCDLFSLGAMLYQMLTGELPFQGQDTLSLLMALATAEPRPIHQLNPDVPRPLEELVMVLLAKDPEMRPSTAKDVAEGLTAVEEGRPHSMEGSTTGQLSTNGNATRRENAVSLALQMVRTPGKLGWIVKGVLGLLALLIVVGLFLLFRPGEKPTTSSSAPPPDQAKVSDQIKDKPSVIPPDVLPPAGGKPAPDPQREKALKDALAAAKGPSGGPRAMKGPGMLLIAYYLEQERFADAEETARDLMPRGGGGLRPRGSLSSLVRAITLALQGKAKESNNFFAETANALASGGPAGAQQRRTDELIGSLKSWTLKALDRNAKAEGGLPAEVETFRKNIQK